MESGEYALIDVGTCSMCRSSRLETLAEMDRFALPFRADICCDCGLIMCSPRLSEKDLPRYYKEVYVPLILGRLNLQQLKHLVNPRQGKIIYNFCQPVLSGLSKKILTVAEIGCASGHNLYQFGMQARTQGLSCQLVGCEYSEYFNEYAEKELGIRYIIGGCSDLIEQGVTADILILSHVFEHFVDLHSVKKQLQRLMTSEGLLYIEVPGILDLKNKFEYNCDFLHYRVHAHIHDFSLTTLRNVLSPEFVLIDGTEYCRSIFKKAQRVDTPPLNMNDYEHIKYSLKDLEIYRKEHRYRIHTRRFLHRALRRLRRACY